MQLSSPAFAHNKSIPSKFTCDGDDINPQLDVTKVPDGTQSLVLIMDDPDAPMGTWDHWIMWNIPVSERIAENSVPAGAVQGRNGWNRSDYGGPCPPPPTGEHRYIFKLYALDSKLSLAEGATKAELETAMEGHVLATTELLGRYNKS